MPLHAVIPYMMQKRKGSFIKSEPLQKLADSHVFSPTHYFHMQNDFGKI